MLKTIYDASGLMVLTVASWGLKQVGDGVGAIRRRLNGRGPENQTGKRAAAKRSTASNGRAGKARSRTTARRRSAHIDPLDL
jgi:hypothetical protein